MKIQTYKEPENWQQNKILIKDIIVEKEEAHEDNLLHLSTHLLIVNGNGELMCRKRSEDEFRYKGQWTTTIGTHVELGSDYFKTLKKYLPNDMDLKYMGEFKLNDGFENEVCGLYVARLGEERLSQKFRNDRSFLSFETLERFICEEKTTPHLKYAYGLLGGK